MCLSLLVKDNTSSSVIFLLVGGGGGSVIAKKERWVVEYFRWRRLSQRFG